jgi:hypothetical protein
MEVIYFVSRLRISFSVYITHAKRAFHCIRSSSLSVLATRQRSTGVRQKMSLHCSSFGLFISNSKRLVQVESYCCVTVESCCCVTVESYCCVTCFPHSVRHSCVYQTVGQVFVFPLQRSPCTVLSAIVSQLFLPRDRPCAYSFKTLLQRWKQVTIDRRRIPRRNHIHCRIFCREIS